MLFFIDKSRKRDVTDLNFLERQMLYCTDNIRLLYSLSNSRLDSSRDISAGSNPAQGAEIARKLHRTLQILRVHPLEKITLYELLMKNKIKNSDEANFKQMELFDL